MLSEAWEALMDAPTSRNAADGMNGDDPSLRGGKAVTVDGAGEDRGEGDAAPRRMASRAIKVVACAVGSPARCMNRSSCPLLLDCEEHGRQVRKRVQMKVRRNNIIDQHTRVVVTSR